MGLRVGFSAVFRQVHGMLKIIVISLLKYAASASQLLLCVRFLFRVSLCLLTNSTDAMAARPTLTQLRRLLHRPNVHWLCMVLFR